MIGWIVLCVIVLIFFLPVTLRAAYDDDFSLRALLFGIPVFVYPASEKKKKTKKSKKPEKNRPKSGKKSFLRDLLRNFRDYLALVRDVLGELRRKLTVREFALHAVFGGSEPDERALGYGKAWAAIGAFLPAVERLFRIRRRDVRAVYSPVEPKVRLFVKIVLSVPLGKLLFIALKALWRYSKIQKKAVLKHE